MGYRLRLSLRILCNCRLVRERYRRARHFSEQLAMAGAALGLAAIFIESYPNPAEARCDGPSGVPLERVPKLLRRIKEMDE
jgi:3-deoxy-D-manno-octulosonic acid (KDO) 8-phosphate synthase